MRKLYQKMWLTSAFALILTSSVLAQERNISGTVTDESGNSMPGVSVVIKGTSDGTATDVNGRFVIQVPGDAAILVFTFVGYASTEVQAGSRSTVDVQMTPDVQTLSELIVTGYSVDSRRELTGAVSTVATEDLTFAPSGNVEQMLQGRVPGVTVITNGQPGTTSQIRVRGFGSFGGNQPLYIVDGVPTDNVDFLNPDDIESTTVLKDAAAASIYGARAASGVILYTTKRGKAGEGLRVTYDNMFGYTDPGKGIDMLAPDQFMEWTWNAQRNTENANAAAEGRAVDYATAFAKFNHPQFGGGLTPVMPEWLSVGGVPGASVVGTVNLEEERLKYNIDPRNGAIYQVIRANRSGTDWYKELTRNAPIFRQTLGFSGSGENSRFYVGLSMYDQKGIMINNSLKRYAMRVNSEFNVLKNLRFGENIQVTYRSALGLTGDGGGAGSSDDENDILSAFRMPTIIPVYDEFGGFAGTAAKGFNNPRNPIAGRTGLEDNEAFATSAFGNFYLEYDPIPGLTLRTSLGGSYNAYNNVGYSRWQYENSENNSAFGFNQGNGYNMAWTFTNTAVYGKSFGDHNAEILVGQEALNTGAGWNSGQSGLNPFSWDPNFINMSQVSSVVANSSQFKGVNFYSLFGQVKYSFKERYIFRGVVRRDGSSRFGENNRYGVFPAASFAWRISAEPFMAGVSWVTDLKIRGGYGEMGNSNNVDPNNQFFLYGGSLGLSSYDIAGTNSSAPIGFYRTRIGNADAKWETSVTKNIGIDGQLFDGKLDVIIDFWEKETKDLLLAVPITATVGYRAAAPAVNVATMVNKGIDILIGTKGNFTSELSYDFKLSGGILNNEITSIAPGLNYLTTVNPNFRGIEPIRNQIGKSISSFYGYNVVGLFSSAEEVAAAAEQSGAAPGRFRYEDVNDDGVITADDRTYLGSPVPKFTGGFDFTLYYKGFELQGYFFASLGNKVWNQSRWFTDFYPSFQGAAISSRVLDSWTPQNLDAEIPVFESASNFSTNTQASSFYVEDGSYLRLQNVTLAYNLPASLLERIRLSKIRVFAAANNLFTITDYNGLDPSVGGSADTNFGIDIGNYPITRSYTMGINVAF